MADSDHTITASPGEVAPGYKPLLGSIASLFENPKFSDYIFKCEGKTWNVHKNIVGCQSDVFEKACNGQFKEGTDGVMALPYDDHHVVNEMLRYLYTADYQEEHVEEHTCFTPMLLSVHIHTIADKYNIPALAKLAESKFAARAAAHWNTEDFANAIEEMYTTAPHSKTAMHECAIDTAVNNAKALYGEDCGQRFREVSSTTLEFTSNFAAKLVEGNNYNAGEVWYSCRFCGVAWISRSPPRYGDACVRCGEPSQEWGSPYWKITH